MHFYPCWHWDHGSSFIVIVRFCLFNGIFNRTHAVYVAYARIVIRINLTVINTPLEAVLNLHENIHYYAVVGFFESGLKFLVVHAFSYAT